MEAYTDINCAALRVVEINERVFGTLDDLHRVISTSSQGLGISCATLRVVEITERVLGAIDDLQRASHIT